MDEVDSASTLAGALCVAFSLACGGGGGGGGPGAGGGGGGAGGGAPAAASSVMTGSWDTGEGSGGLTPALEPRLSIPAHEATCHAAHGHVCPPT